MGAYREEYEVGIDRLSRQLGRHLPFTVSPSNFHLIHFHNYLFNGRKSIFRESGQLG